MNYQKNRVHEYGEENTKGYFDRNVFLPYEEIIERAVGKIDQYYSIFSYRPEDTAGSDLYAPFYLDIDKEDDLKTSYKATQQVLSMMNAYGVEDQDRSVYFSGKKGFHIEVAPEVFGLVPMEYLDKIYKQIAGWFSENLPFGVVDFVVYERRRLWRIPNTINKKSGLYKIQITGDEPLDIILKNAKKTQKLIQPVPRRNEVYAGWIERAQGELAEKERKQKEYQQYIQNNYDKKGIGLWTQDKLDNGVVEGERDNVAFSIACYLRDRDYTEDEVAEFLIPFGKKCDPPLDDKTILIKIRSAFSRVKRQVIQHDM
jgi:hypothetical protein